MPSPCHRIVGLCNPFLRTHKRILREQFAKMSSKFPSRSSLSHSVCTVSLLPSSWICLVGDFFRIRSHVFLFITIFHRPFGKICFLVVLTTLSKLKWRVFLCQNLEQTMKFSLWRCFFGRPFAFCLWHNDMDVSWHVKEMQSISYVYQICRDPSSFCGWVWWRGVLQRIRNAYYLECIMYHSQFLRLDPYKQSNLRNCHSFFGFNIRFFRKWPAAKTRASRWLQKFRICGSWKLFGGVVWLQKPIFVGESLSLIEKYCLQVAMLFCQDIWSYYDPNSRIIYKMSKYDC